MIRVLLDAQLPEGLCAWFADRGIEATHVRTILGGQTPDIEIARRASADARVLLTKDDDFRLRHPPGTYRLAWLRCGNMSNRVLRRWLDDRWPEVLRRLDDGDVFVEVR